MYFSLRKCPNWIYSSDTLWCSFSLMSFQRFGSQSQVTTSGDTCLSAWGAKARCEDRGHHLFKLWRWRPCCSACQTKQTRTGGRQSDANTFGQLHHLESQTVWRNVKLLLGRRDSECRLAAWAITKEKQDGQIPNTHADACTCHFLWTYCL